MVISYYLSSITNIIIYKKLSQFLSQSTHRENFLFQFLSTDFLFLSHVTDSIIVRGWYVTRLRYNILICM